MSKWVSTCAALACGASVAVASFATSAEARTVELKDDNGVSSGWEYTIPDAYADRVDLSVVRVENGTFYINKTANVLSNTNPLIVEFNKTGDGEAANLAIATENVTNSTGVDWVGFRMSLSSGTSDGQPMFAFSEGSIDDWDIDPFTQFAVRDNNTELILSGGTVRADTVWTPGSATGSALNIVANSSMGTRFILKEIPIPIPLPAAALTGVATLAGLGAVQQLRRRVSR